MPLQDEHVPHEQEHADATDAQMRRTSDHASIQDLGVYEPEDLIPGTSTLSETQVAVNDMAVEIRALIENSNSILAVLRDAELLPPEEEEEPV